MKHMDIHKQTVGETHFLAIQNLHIKCIWPATVSSPCWPLGQDLSSALQEPPGTPGPGEGRHEAIIELQATGYPLSFPVCWERASMPGTVGK